MSALLRFRDLECQNPKWTYWCNWLDTQDDDNRQQLPHEENLPERLSAVDVDSTKDSMIESILKDEIDCQLSKNDWVEMRFGGEGEPTLNLRALKYLAVEFRDKIPITVMTNGLTDCASLLKEWGVSGVSVALATNAPEQYLSLMEPCIVGCAHERVCSFIRSALSCNLQVEITAVDRPGINKDKTNELAMLLGVQSQIRWRPYFP